MKRIFGLDLVRCFAVLFIPAVHFFLFSGFYQNKISGYASIIKIFILWLVYIGVPLFLLLTGYLMYKKKLNKKYYKGIIPVLTSYVFISIICVLVRKFYLHDDLRILKMIISIFNFTGDEYAWYVEMYIGLFLLIPFLNVLWNALEEKRNKQYLIVTFLAICTLSPVVSSIKISGLTLDIIPNWWINLYPLLYYYIGCYISEYKPTINKLKLGLLLITILLFVTKLSYFNYLGGIFTKTFMWGYSSLPIVVISLLFFLLLYDLNVKNKIVTKVVTSISLLSFDIYLFSYIVDRIVYGHLDNIFDQNLYFKHMFFIIMFVFVCSYILAFIKRIIFSCCSWITKKMNLV